MTTKFLIGILGLTSLLSGVVLRAQDCNDNGIDDALEVELPSLGLVRVGEIETFVGSNCVATGDLDGDGDADLVVTSSEIALLLVFENTGGAFSLSFSRFLDQQAFSILVDDFDHDGASDIVVEDGVGVRLLLNDGRGRFPEIVTTQIRVQSTTLRQGDIDGDGDLDLLGSDRQSDTFIIVFLNRGDGSFQSPETIVSPRSFWEVSTGDVDGDGALDLLVNGNDSSLSILFNDGDGSFGGRQSFLHGVLLVASGDLDTDGDLDLVVRSGPSAVMLSNDGSGGFVELQRLDVMEELGLADLDGDADLDGFFWTGGRSEIQLLANVDGRGFDVLPSGHRVLTLRRCVVAIDTDGDGASEVAVGSFGSSRIRFLGNDPFAVGDCDRDGVLDECADTVSDCDGDGVNDLCEVLSGLAQDCDDNLVPDACELTSGASADCNRNGIPDACDIASGLSLDLVANGIPDECDLDCNGNGVNDGVEIASGAPDCDANGIPDE